MTIRSSSSSGIPFGNIAGRPANPTTGQPYFNGEEKRLELYTSSGWQNIVSETPGVVSISGNYIETSGSGTIDIVGTNFSTGAIASAIGTNGVEIQADTTLVNSIVSITATFTGLSVSYEPYDIKVTNTSNLFGLLPDALYINDKPLWSTSSGSLGTFNSGDSVSLQLAATDDESSTLTYTISSGSLPGGLSMSSSGLISGTIIATSGTSSFTVSVSDGSNAGQTRSFSITCVAAVVTGGTLSSDSTYYYRTFTGNGTLSVSNASISCNYLVVAGGGSGGGVAPSGGYHAGGGGGGAGGYRNGSNSTSTGNYSVVVGAGGGSGLSGNASSLFGVESAGGGAGFYGGYGTAAQNGGSGGGAGRDTPTIGYGNTPSTIPSQGNDGGSYGGTNAAAGGGGAGASGGNSSGGTPGNGGSGSNSHATWLSAISSAMTGVSGWNSATGNGYIAGGGGGGAGNGNTGTSSGGAGGGAGQPSYGGSNGVAAVTNTGGGGAGASAHNNPNGYSSGNGGSGIVIVRYSRAAVGG